MPNDILIFLMDHPDITITLDCRDKKGLFITMTEHNGYGNRIRRLVDLSIKDTYMDGYFQTIINNMYEKLRGGKIK